jgi:hypothetical protein
MGQMGKTQECDTVKVASGGSVREGVEEQLPIEKATSQALRKCLSSEK